MAAFNANCHVCMSELPVEVFRRLAACGHCFCRPCISQIVQSPRQQRRCPSCRAAIQGEGDAQPIYLEIAAVKPLASMVADGLGRMDANAKVVSVQKAGKKLEQVAAMEGMDRDGLEELLQAISDFNARIVPVFTKAREQEAEIAALKKQVGEAKTLRDQSDEVMRLSGEVTMLRSANLKSRKELKASEEQTDKAVKLAADAAEEVKKVRIALDHMETTSQGEIRRLKGLLERNADDRHRDRQKIDHISRQRDAFQEQVVTLEKEVDRLKGGDDLQIEPEEDTFGSEWSESISPEQHSSPRRIKAVKLGFEGMPKPGFGTDWKLGHGTKRKERDELPAGYPIAVKQGRLMQLGPKHTVRVKAV
ncbi:hypothetical protein C8F01DRAFT_1123369, partial [Mycena amicta]